MFCLRVTGGGLGQVVGQDLVVQGLHLLHAVGKAATTPPRLVVLKYTGDPSRPDQCIAVVGKVRLYPPHQFACRTHTIDHDG